MKFRVALDDPVTAICVRIAMIAVSLAVGAEVFLVRCTDTCTRRAKMRPQNE